MPGEQRVDPRGNGIAIAAKRIDGEFRAPAIVRQRDHGHELPCPLVVAAVQEPTRERIVSVGKAIGFDDDGFADRALDRKAATVDGRRDVLDDDPDAAIRGERR